MVDVEEKDDKRIFLMVAGLGFLGLLLVSAVVGDDFNKSRCVLYCNNQGYDKNGNESPDWYECYEKCMGRDKAMPKEEQVSGNTPVLCPI
jgi:hypothetical protein